MKTKADRFQAAAERIAESRNLPLVAAKIIAAVWIGLHTFFTWPGTIVKGLWADASGLIDRAMAKVEWWQKLATKRLAKRIARCDRIGHPLRGTVMPSGAPGKMCDTCGYAVEISAHQFKKLFGISIQTAVARAQRRGHEVANAEKVKPRHAN